MKKIIRTNMAKSSDMEDFKALVEAFIGQYRAEGLEVEVQYSFSAPTL